MQGKQNILSSVLFALAPILISLPALAFDHDLTNFLKELLINPKAFASCHKALP